MAKSTLFLFAAYTMYGVIESGPKPLISPTNRYKLEAQKTYDILNPVSLVSVDDCCYVFEHLTSTEFL